MILYLPQVLTVLSLKRHEWLELVLDQQRGELCNKTLKVHKTPHKMQTPESNSPQQKEKKKKTRPHYYWYAHSFVFPQVAEWLCRKQIYLLSQRQQNIWWLPNNSRLATPFFQISVTLNSHIVVVSWGMFLICFIHIPTFYFTVVVPAWTRCLFITMGKPVYGGSPPSSAREAIDKCCTFFTFTSVGLSSTICSFHL